MLISIPIILNNKFVEAQTTNSCSNLIQNPGFDCSGSYGFTNSSLDPENFDNIIYSTDVQGFGQGHVANWYVTDDTPDSWINTGPGGTACLFMNSHNGSGEGTAPTEEAVGQTLATNLVQGQSYIIKFSARQTRPQNINSIFPKLRIRFSTDTDFTTGTFQDVFNENIQEYPIETPNGTFRHFELCFTANENWTDIQIKNSLDDATSTFFSGIMFDDLELYEFDPGVFALDLIAPNPICNNQTFTITDPNCVIDGVGLQWYQVNINTGVETLLVGETSEELTLSLPTGNYLFILKKTFLDCDISRKILIKVRPTPNLTISPPQPICTGESANLLVGGANAYVWNNASTLNNAFIPNPIATPTNTTTYTVTGTNLYGCSSFTSTTITVNPLPIVSILASETSVCPEQPVVLTAAGATTYTWSNGLGTGNPITVNPNVTTTYVVTGTTNGCSNTFPITINVNELICICDDDLTTPIGTNGTLTGTYSNSVFQLLNNVTISGTVNFNNVEIKIAPNVKITLNSNAILNINGSHLYACKEMWTGIELLTNSKIRVGDLMVSGVQKTSLIEDAFIAIDWSPNTLTSSSSAQISLKNVTFNRNRIAINITNQAGPTFFGLTKIENCVITSRNLPFNTYNASIMTWVRTNDLRIFTNPDGINPHSKQYISESLYPFLNLKAPYSFSKPLFGLYIENITNGNAYFNLGSVANFNIFDCANYLLVNKNSNLNSAGNFFQNTINNGYGVFAQEIRPNNIFVNKCKLSSNYFVNCNSSIYIDKFNYVLVNNNEIRSNQKEITYGNIAIIPNHPGKSAIVLSGGKFDTYSVINNRIYNMERGIEFKPSHVNISGTENVLFNEVLIQDNLIYRNMTSTDYGGYIRDAIIANDFGVEYSTSISNINIEDNIINEVNRGIQTNNWKKFKLLLIDDNIITLKQSLYTSSNYYGIDFNNNEKVEFGQNKDQIKNNNITGFSNSLTNSNNNMAIKISSSLKANVMCNTVKNTKYGIYFSSYNNINLVRNEMDNNGYGLVLDNNGVIGQQGSIAHLSYGNRFINFSAGHYKTATMNSSNARESMLVVIDDAIHNPDGSGVSFDISYPYIETPISDGPTSIFSLPNYFVPPCASFGMQPNSPNEVLLSDKNYMNRVINNEVNFEINSEQAKQNTKQVIFDRLTNEPNLLVNEPILTSFYTNEEQLNNGKIKRTKNKINQGLYSEAQYEVNTMLIENEMDENVKRFYEMYLVYSNDTITFSDSLDLFNLSDQCPEISGTVVFQARALYGTLYGYDYVFNPSCSVQFRLNNSMNTLEDVPLAPNKEEIDILVFPNPLKNKCYVSGEDIENTQIEIIDLQGRIYSFENHKIHKNLIELSTNLSKGVYFISIQIGGRKQLKKIIVE